MQAVLMQAGKLWVDEVADPIPNAEQIVVKSKACGICGSDLHATLHTEEFIKTSREAGGAFKLTTNEAVILGHEFCAEVIESDEQFRAGQLVCSLPMLMGADPSPIGYSDTVPGGFAQYMLLSKTLVLPVPEGTPAQAAALTEPMAVGLHAVNKAQLQGDEAIVVIGCGPVGLAVITALNRMRKSSHHKLGPIVAADFSPARQQWALSQGADIVVDAAIENPLHHDELKDHNVVVFECVGIPGMIDKLFLDVPNNTHIVVVGVCLQSDQIRPLIAINKELSLQFVLGYSVNEFAQSLNYIADGSFDVAGLVSHSIGLDEVEQTFASLAQPDAFGKVIVKPWAD